MALIFCSKCGKQLDSSSGFCPNCGNMVSSNAGPMNYTRPAVNSGQSLTWHYILCYGFLWLGALSDFIYFIRYINGSIYSGAKKLVYYYFEGLESLDKFFAICLLGGMIFCIVTAINLIKFNSGAPSMLTALYVYNICVALLYYIILKAIIKSKLDLDADVFSSANTQVYMSVGVGILMIIVNKIYYGNRMELFDPRKRSVYANKNYTLPGTSPYSGSSSYGSSSYSSGGLLGNKPKQEGWLCYRCGTVNPSYVSTCQCGLSREDAEPPASAKSKELHPVDAEILKNGGWKCEKCGRINRVYIGTCQCGTNKETADAMLQEKLIDQKRDEQYAELKKLKEMVELGIISEAEFEEKRRKILGR